MSQSTRDRLISAVRRRQLPIRVRLLPSGIRRAGRSVIVIAAAIAIPLVGISVGPAPFRSALVAGWTAPTPQGWSWAGKAKPRPTGVTDEKGAFDPGVIQVKVANGVNVDAALRGHSVGGSISHWNAPPFSAYDIKGGLDRWYRVAVPSGTEKTVVTLLAPFTKEFDYVGLAWVSARRAFFEPNDPMCVAGYQGNLAAMHLPHARGIEPRARRQ